MVPINISAVHFNEDDLEDVIAKSLRTGLYPQHLELELTETGILQDPELAINTLMSFKRTGLRVSLDDFDTGYSSLSYLMKLPLDKLKIDKSFMQTMKGGSRGASIVPAIAAMSHSLDMSVIVEGMENDNHLQLLRQMHCDMVQDYHIACPVPASHFEEMFADMLKRRA